MSNSEIGHLSDLPSLTGWFIPPRIPCGASKLIRNPTLVWMALRTDMEAILPSSSCLSSSITRAASLSRFGHSKTQWGPLKRKHVYFVGASSFLPLSLCCGGRSLLGERFLSPSLSLYSWSFLLCPFDESLFNSIKDSAAAIAEARYCTPCLSSSSWHNLLGHRGSRIRHLALPCSEFPRVTLETHLHTRGFAHLHAEAVEAWPLISAIFS